MLHSMLLMLEVILLLLLLLLLPLRTPACTPELLETPACTPALVLLLLLLQTPACCGLLLETPELLETPACTPALVLLQTHAAARNLLQPWACSDRRSRLTFGHGNCRGQRMIGNCLASCHHADTRCEEVVAAAKEPLVQL